jgi:thioredoxin-related protein
MKILKFSLPTCKPCVTLSEQMKELDLSNFEIQEVNLRADKESKELGDKYNIRNVPTLVVLDEQGNEVERIRNIIQLKTFLKTKPVLVFEEKIEKGKYVAGFDDYKEEKVKTSWINKIKNIFK